MATRDTTGTVGNSTGSGLGASRTGSTSTPMGADGSQLEVQLRVVPVLDSVRDSVSSTVDQAKRQAEAEGNRLVGAARTRARSAFEHQQHRVADSIGSVAQALHQAADKLNEQNEDVVARYTDTAAQRIEQFADSLRNRNLDDLVGQAEQFARRQPEVFLGTAVATGFLIARFLRTSGSRASQRRSNLSYGGGNTGSYGSTASAATAAMAARTAIRSRAANAARAMAAAEAVIPAAPPPPVQPARAAFRAPGRQAEAPRERAPHLGVPPVEPPPAPPVRAPAPWSGTPASSALPKRPRSPAPA